MATATVAAAAAASARPLASQGVRRADTKSRDEAAAVVAEQRRQAYLVDLHALLDSRYNIPPPSKELPETVDDPNQYIMQNQEWFENIRIDIDDPHNKDTNDLCIKWDVPTFADTSGDQKKGNLKGTIEWRPELGRGKAPCFASLYHTVTRDGMWHPYFGNLSHVHKHRPDLSKFLLTDNWKEAQNDFAYDGYPWNPDLINDNDPGQRDLYHARLLNWYRNRVNVWAVAYAVLDPAADGPLRKVQVLQTMFNSPECKRDKYKVILKFLNQGTVQNPFTIRFDKDEQGDLMNTDMLHMRHQVCWPHRDRVNADGSKPKEHELETDKVIGTFGTKKPVWAAIAREMKQAKYDLKPVRINTYAATRSEDTGEMQVTSVQMPIDAFLSPQQHVVALNVKMKVSFYNGGLAVVLTPLDRYFGAPMLNYYKDIDVPRILSPVRAMADTQLFDQQAASRLKHLKPGGPTAIADDPCAKPWSEEEEAKFLASLKLGLAHQKFPDKDKPQQLAITHQPAVVLRADENGMVDAEEAAAALTAEYKPPQADTRPATEEELLALPEVERPAAPATNKRKSPSQEPPKSPRRPPVEDKAVKKAKPADTPPKSPRRQTIEEHVDEASVKAAKKGKATSAVSADKAAPMVRKAVEESAVSADTDTEMSHAPPPEEDSAAKQVYQAQMAKQKRMQHAAMKRLQAQQQTPPPLETDD